MFQLIFSTQFLRSTPALTSLYLQGAFQAFGLLPMAHGKAMAPCIRGGGQRTLFFIHKTLA